MVFKFCRVVIVLMLGVYSYSRLFCNNQWYRSLEHSFIWRITSDTVSTPLSTRPTASPTAELFSRNWESFATPPPKSHWKHTLPAGTWYTPRSGPALTRVIQWVWLEQSWTDSREKSIIICCLCWPSLTSDEKASNRKNIIFHPSDVHAQRCAAIYYY